MRDQQRKALKAVLLKLYILNRNLNLLLPIKIFPIGQRKIYKRQLMYGKQTLLHRFPSQSMLLGDDLLPMES